MTAHHWIWGTKENVGVCWYGRGYHTHRDLCAGKRCHLSGCLTNKKSFYLYTEIIRQRNNFKK